MKAIQLVAPGRLVETELPSRPLRAWEVQVAVACTCVCGSDLKNINTPVMLPQVPGHEFSGVVVARSPEVIDSLDIGCKVTAFPMMACMDCLDCLSGRFRDCADKLSLGFQLPGSFAEEVIVDSRLIVPLPDGLTYEQGALVEHLCCGYRLAKEIIAQKVPVEAHFVIVGDGAIALADVQSLRLFGYRNITLIGKYPLRMDVARKLGVSRVVSSVDFRAIMEKKDISPTDVCIMAAPAEQTLTEMLPLLKPQSLVFPQSRIRSSVVLHYLEDHGIGMGRAFAYAFEDFPEVMSLIKNGTLDTDSLVTNRFNLSQFVENFSAVQQKEKYLKTVIINERLDEIIEKYR